jgi:hypothetical protein
MVPSGCGAEIVIERLLCRARARRHHSGWPGFGSVGGGSSALRRPTPHRDETRGDRRRASTD